VFVDEGTSGRDTSLLASAAGFVSWGPSCASSVRNRAWERFMRYWVSSLPVISRQIAEVDQHRQGTVLIWLGAECCTQNSKKNNLS
jgi:hypothetical protein